MTVNIYIRLLEFSNEKPNVISEEAGIDEEHAVVGQGGGSSTPVSVN